MCTTYIHFGSRLICLHEEKVKVFMFVKCRIKQYLNRPPFLCAWLWLIWLERGGDRWLWWLEGGRGGGGTVGL